MTVQRSHLHPFAEYIFPFLNVIHKIIVKKTATCVHCVWRYRGMSSVFAQSKLTNKSNLHWKTSEMVVQEKHGQKENYFTILIFTIHQNPFQRLFGRKHSHLLTINSY